MENKDKIIDILTEWVNAWRDANGIEAGEMLSGETLGRFIGMA